jgi:hypothetical protein
VKQTALICILAANVFAFDWRIGVEINHVPYVSDFRNPTDNTLQQTAESQTSFGFKFGGGILFKHLGMNLRAGKLIRKIVVAETPITSELSPDPTYAAPVARSVHTFYYSLIEPEFVLRKSAPNYGIEYAGTIGAEFREKSEPIRHNENKNDINFSVGGYIAWHGAYLHARQAFFVPGGSNFQETNQLMLSLGYHADY